MQIGFNLLHVFLLPLNLWKKMGLSLLLAVNPCASKHSGQGGVCRGGMQAGAALRESTAVLLGCPVAWGGGGRGAGVFICVIGT